jgi:hypothetical protein
MAENHANLPHGGAIYSAKSEASAEALGVDSSVEPSISLSKAAKAAGVSQSSVKRVRKLKKTAIPEVLKALEAGRITVRQAERIAKA